MITRFWQVTLAILFLDQVSKFVVSWVFPQAIQLNKGISFGFIGNSNFLLITISLVVLIGVYGWQFGNIFEKKASSSKTPKSRLEQLAWGLFFGGGISNLIDRFLWGGVKDWLFLPVLGLRNNLADYAISLGLISLVAVYYWQENKYGIRDST